jgi:hypothetical protein
MARFLRHRRAAPLPEQDIERSLRTRKIRWFDARRGDTVCQVTPERRSATHRAVEDEFDDASPVAAAT